MTRAALQVSLRSARASLRQVAIRPRPRPALAQRSFTSGIHAFATAAVLASLALQASERSLKCSLTHAPMRPSPGWTSAQCFLISAAHTPARGCAIALVVVPKSEAPATSVPTSGSRFIAVLLFPITNAKRERSSSIWPFNPGQNPQPHGDIVLPRSQCVKWIRSELDQTRRADKANAPKVISSAPATRVFKALESSCIASAPLLWVISCQARSIRSRQTLA